MCNKCFEAEKGLNPEPSDVQVATFKRHLASGTVPKAQPKWITEHQRLTGQRLESFKPDFRVVLPNLVTTITKPVLAIPQVTGTIEEFVRAFDEANGLKPVEIVRAA